MTNNIFHFINRSNNMAWDFCAINAADNALKVWRSALFTGSRV